MRNSSKASTRPDPIFAAIDAHRAATAARYPIMKKLMNTRGKAAASRLEASHDKAADAEVAATVKLRKTIPTTLAGVTALTAYFVEHKDRYFDWIGGDVKSKAGTVAYPDGISFEACVIRNCAGALDRLWH